MELTLVCVAGIFGSEIDLALIIHVWDCVGIVDGIDFLSKHQNSPIFLASSHH